MDGDLRERALARAVSLVMNEWGYSAEVAIDWLADDDAWDGSNAYHEYEQGAREAVSEWLRSASA